MAKKHEVEKEVVAVVAVRFVMDFDGHKAGDVLEVSESNLVHFLEWEVVEVVK